MKNYELNFYDSFKDIFVVLDYNLNFVDLNEQAEVFFKVDSHFLMKRNLANFIPKNQFGFLFKRVKSIKTKDNFKFSIILRNKKIDLDLYVQNDYKLKQYVIAVRPIKNEERKYQKVFNNAHVGFLVHDKSGAIVNYNSYALKLLGISKEQLLGKSSFDNSWKVVNEDLTPCLPDQMPSVISQLTGKEVKNKVIGIKIKNDELKWIVVNAVPVFDTTNLKVSETIVTFSDISEIKKIQSELVQLRTALDKAFILSELDANFNFKYTNDNFKKATGLDDISVLNKSIHDVFPFWNSDNCDPKLSDLFKKGDILVNEFSYRLKESDYRWFRGVSCPILNDVGDLEKIISIRIDVSQEKQINNKLSEMNSWHDALFAGSSYAFIATDFEGKIQTFNQAAEKLLGYSADEVINKLNPSVFHKKDEIFKKSKELQKRFSREFNADFEVFAYEALLFGQDTSEWTYIRKDKVEVPVKLCVNAIFDDTGKCIGFLGVAEDLTEQRNMQNLLNEQRAQVLASSKLSSLGELAAGIAHEINNPLAVIIGKSSQIKRALQNGNVDLNRLENEINKIELMGQRISKTIKGMKLFSRNGEFDNFEYKSIAQIIDDTHSICSEKFKDNSVSFHFEVDPSIELMCRPTQISQIILNLMNNAFDATIEKENKVIKLTTMISDEKIKILFQDNGDGVSDEITEKIMEPFFTTKGNGKGTGIGLSISKKIAEDHGGNLYLDKNESLTTFVLEFPLKFVKTNYLKIA